MIRLRIWATSALLIGLIAFWPGDAQSKQYFDATIRFNPKSNSIWHYWTIAQLQGNEILRGKRALIGGIISAIYDEYINSSGDGLVNVSVAFNAYESFDTSSELRFEDPTGGPFAPPDYSALKPDHPGASLPRMGGSSDGMSVGGGRRPEPLQSAGGGGGGSTGGGGGESDDLLGEGEFNILPIMESNINYIMSESGRLLSLSGMELIGEIIDPSRSITVRQVFQTSHFIVVPDYEVHIGESWRAPMSWTIPYVGETMEIPLTFTLADIRTCFRFRVAAIDFSGILQFNVDVSDEGMREDENGKLRSVRKESNIKGDIILQGRAYIDLDRGILVALCDTPAFGDTGFIDSDRRYPYEVTPGFFGQLNFERRDLYTPLGNVIDRRQEIEYRIQELRWYTTTMVE